MEIYMIKLCPTCKKEVYRNREICPECYRPIKSIPIPLNGKIRFGKYDWFVLDKQDDKALILTEKVVEQRPYHSQEIAITWEKCDLRKYLNEELYYSFTPSEQKQIIETRLVTHDNPWYGTDGGKPTTDKIFCLSIEEVVKYFGDSGQLKTKNKNPGCDWLKDEYFFFLSDKYDINRRAVDDSGKVVSWRLRSPGACSRYAVMVLGDCQDEFDHGDINIASGGILRDGHIIYDSEDEIGELSIPFGIRPALWLRLL